MALSVPDNRTVVMEDIVPRDNDAELARAIEQLVASQHLAGDSTMEREAREESAVWL